MIVLSAEKHLSRNQFSSFSFKTLSWKASIVFHTITGDVQFKPTWKKLKHPLKFSQYQKLPRTASFDVKKYNTVQTFKDSLTLCTCSQAPPAEKNRETNFQKSFCPIPFSLHYTSTQHGGEGDKHQGHETPWGKRKENAGRQWNIKASSVSRLYNEKRLLFSAPFFLMSTSFKVTSNTWKRACLHHNLVYISAFILMQMLQPCIPLHFPQTALIILSRIKAHTWCLL